MINKKIYRTLLVLFFLSGATALVYQVVWTRLLTLAFGSTMLAVSTVLTVFMGGLAIGSALIGKRADRAANPVRWYAVLELLIGLFAIATPLIHSGIESVYTGLHQGGESGFWQSAMLRFGLSLIMLLPPTIMMGGTLPLLSKVFLHEKNDNTGKALSSLYFINTVGAVAGTLLAGLFLLQLLGIKLLLLCAGAVNIGIFLYAYRLKPDSVISAGLSHEPDKEHSDTTGGWSKEALLAAAALFISGLAALIYEVVWTRVLTLIIGSSTYAFTVMLATFLAGIAIGSAAIGKMSDKSKNRMGLLALCQVLIGVFALITASAFGMLPDAFIYLFGKVGDNFNIFLTSNFLLCFIVMVPATLFMGASFPVAGAIVVEAFGSSGRRIGLLYAGNTVGAILGAFLAGFIFLPWIGISKTLLMTIILNLLAGLGLSIFALSKHKGSSLSKAVVPAFSACLLILLSFVWQPEWDSQKMTSGPYAYASQYQNKSIDERYANIEQLFYQEGPIATVAVIQEGKHVRLSVDGKTDAGNFRDMTTQVFIGHLPLLFRPEAKDVLVIGFASGITAGAVSRHDVDLIDCVEIEPAMKEASMFFKKENYNILEDRRFNLIVDDGRSYALTSKKKYDIVISEPSNPWQSGSSRLFTREAFSNAKRLLKEDGLMLQWMHLYGTSVESIRLVARTFMKEFPHTTMWMDPVYADIVFVGSENEFRIDPAAVRTMYAENPKVKESLSRIGYPEDWSIMKAFLLGEKELKKFAGEGELNTDDLPFLEYRAPKSLYSKTALQENVEAFRKHKAREAFPLIKNNIPDPELSASVLRDWSRSLLNNKSISNAKGALLAASDIDPGDPESLMQLGYLRMGTKDYEGAISAYQKAVNIDPDAGQAYSNLGMLHYQSGQLEEAYRYLNLSTVHGQDSAGTRNNMAVILAKQGKFSLAVKEVEKALLLDPGDTIARNNLEKFKQLSNKRSN